VGVLGLFLDVFQVLHRLVAILTLEILQLVGRVADILGGGVLGGGLQLPLTLALARLGAVGAGLAAALTFLARPRLAGRVLRRLRLRLAALLALLLALLALRLLLGGRLAALLLLAGAVLVGRFRRVLRLLRLALPLLIAGLLFGFGLLLTLLA